MKVLGIVPARMASTRFPGKPMAKIHGIPMIGHCYLRSRLAGSMDDVWVATCDEEIRLYVESIGGGCVMTSDRHERASDRAAEALIEVERRTGNRYDYVALIQGDEPMLAPEMLDQLVEPVRVSDDHAVVNLMSAITSEVEFEDPNTVKIVARPDGTALYFSREPIPSRKKYDDAVPMWKQLGMILFSRDALLSFATLLPTPLEVIESVDMNRFLEHGEQIYLVPTEHPSHAVDTPEDLERVSSAMAGDPLMGRYAPPQDPGS